MRFETLGDQGVVEGSSNFLEKEGGARHEVGDGVAQLLYGVVRIICDEDQRVFSLVCFVSVCDLRNSDALCGGQLHIVEVGEGVHENLLGAKARDKAPRWTLAHSNGHMGLGQETVNPEGMLLDGVKGLRRGGNTILRIMLARVQAATNATRQAEKDEHRTQSEQRSHVAAILKARETLDEGY